jgi:mannose-6-phosphate isomerase-like protein (cupin superfamily)
MVLVICLLVPRDAIFLMTCDKSTTTETAARWAMQHQMKLQRGGSSGRKVCKGIYASEQSEGKEFLSRRMGCKGDRFQLRALQTGRGRDLRASSQSEEEMFIALKGDGTIILDGKRIKMPEGTHHPVGPTVWRALGNDAKSAVVFMVLGAIPPKNFPLGGRTFLGDGIPDRKKVPCWKKA